MSLTSGGYALMALVMRNASRKIRARNTHAPGGPTGMGWSVSGSIQDETDEGRYFLTLVLRDKKAFDETARPRHGRSFTLWDWIQQGGSDS